MIPKAMASRARSLAALGLDDVAWSREDAIELLAQFSGEPVAVLGGDVYIESAGHLKPAYENWYCERRPGETLQTYSQRSQQQALTFLRSYRDSPEVLFALVLNDGLLAGS